MPSGVPLGAKKRRRGLSLEERVWRWLKKHPQARVSDLPCVFSIDRKGASSVLRRLLAKGCATRTGQSYLVRYTATAKPPDDFRGLHPNSVRTLQQYTAARHEQGYYPFQNKE